MPEQPEDSWNMLIYPYFLIVSSVFLIITFLVYAALPEIRNIHGVTIMSQVASLAVMYITLGLIQLHVGGYDDPVSYRICIVLGRPNHFQIIYSNMWRMIRFESYQAWWPISPGCLRSPGWMWWVSTSGGHSGSIKSPCLCVDETRWIPISSIFKKDISQLLFGRMAHNHSILP